MSVEHMLLETSIARMIVAWPVGTFTVVTGVPGNDQAGQRQGEQPKAGGVARATARKRCAYQLSWNSAP